ncbi:hypothetical protein [Sulfurimonas marina]|uniref:Uncharacterized protein n=1 Tax=Sulfurimonas marina TaxID=2590551 RepID=A0A7M1AWG6_9BACT|nr:hypothetical protein [Sulfurimonas marina]QOP41765.1 hypothetical protein FJR03_08440 [Sulfurimonas marina]
MQRSQTYIAIDDTDEIAYFTSTGEICEELRAHLDAKNIKTTPVTRHQLLLDHRVPYTSHNSSMCFSAEFNPVELEEFKVYAIAHLTKQSAPSSAPALCICQYKDIVSKEDLIEYGVKTKNTLMTPHQAYITAQKHKIFLLSLKENDQGVVGALAGVALRISGNDGAMKGRIDIGQEFSTYDDIEALEHFDEILLINGKKVNPSYPIYTKEFLKGVCIDHKCVLLLEEENNFYKPLSRKQILEY